MNIKSPLIIDLSAWERDTDWQAQAASEVPALMITRLSLGKAYVDPMAISHVEGARSIGSKVGGFHFMEFNDVQGQIDNFLNAARMSGYLVDGYWTMDIPPVLDVEKVPNGRSLLFGGIPNPKRGQIPSWEKPARRSIFPEILRVLSSDPEGDSWAYQIKVWLDAVEQAAGVRPWIYTSVYYWKFTFSRAGNPPSWTNDYKSWGAWYPDDPDAHEWIPPSVIPGGWNTVHLWQYSAGGIIPLCRYDGVDLNKASPDLLTELGESLPPPPPPGETMYKYKITPIGSLVNIRADHSSTSADIGDLLNGHYAEGDVLWEISNQKWLNIVTLDGQPKSGWCAVIYNGQALCTLTENTPPPPSGLPIIRGTLALRAEGYPDKDVDIGEWKPL